jgi:hypothetical protein
MIVEFLTFLLMNFLVIFNSYLILKNFKFDAPEDKFLATCTVAISQIILTLLFLGLMKILCAGNAVLLTLSLTASLIFLDVLKTRRIFIIDLISGLKLLKRFVINKIENLKRVDLCIGLSFLVLIFTIFMIILSGIIMPPSAHDDLLYHLPMAVSWLKSGLIYLVKITTFGDINASMHYPGNAELILLWIMLPFHSDIVADLSQLIFAILGATACYGIARKIKIKKENAIWAPILFLLTPIIILQSRTTYNDVIFASMFLVSINFLLAYRKSQKKLHLIISALSFGVVLGTKYLGITYFFIYILFFCLIYPRKRLSRKIVLDMLIVILFIFLLGGFWYLRNFLERGSIIYPMKVKLFGYTIMNAPHDPMTMYSWLRYKYVSNELEWLIYPFLEAAREYSYEIGFGPQFIGLMIPSIAFIFLSFFVKDREVLFLLFPMLILLFIVSPVKEPRYFISILGIGSVAVSYCISKIKCSKIIKIIAVLCIFFSIFYSIPNLFPCVRNVLKMQNKYDFWLCTYPSYAEGWKWLNEHTSGNNIVAITHFLYPLYGDDLKNNVVFIPSDDYNEWVKALKKNNIKYVVMAPFQNYSYPIREYEFIEKTGLQPAYEMGMIKIYSTEKLGGYHD